MDKIAAIIPAAGYSSRMGIFKPLLPLASSLAIERTVKTFEEAGIEDIRVVSGYKAELLEPVLRRMGVRVVSNQNYYRGMYSSIQAGVATLSDEIAAFFLLPADYPFINSKTIRQLSQAYAKRCPDVVYPVYHGKKGHPPLISARLRSAILENEPEGGLKLLLSRKVKESLQIPVEDAGILLDLDTEEDYRNALQNTLSNYPSREECLKVLKNHQTKDPVFRHVQEVTRVAGIISEHLNSHGLRLHLGLVMASSLLHDIAKGERDHARKGQQIVAALDYPEVADIIGFHMDLPEQYQKVINEYAVVYLADKMVQGDRLVCLETRFRQQIETYQEDADIQRIIVRRMEIAQQIKKNIEGKLNLKLEKILGLQIEDGAEDDGKKYLSCKTC
ncbi:DVU_1551 family NTP transferase [Dehalobacter sp.]|uniref:DVU_1551 family NTP transferase n=1 Tax=Dehalobacter sp. TaxID=1962289 RepID=UPI0002F0E2D9|nr:NTP transferase domain-containing protein [Dehalobacter sp.]MCG1025182.1 NTP transferase domain-containing protein [Dehalobacter sp.]MDJ0304898.1 NTP transferase domain-containing protein [Dehalobacter sp.]